MQASDDGWSSTCILERKDSNNGDKETDGRNPAFGSAPESCNTYRTKLTAQPCLVPVVPNTTCRSR